MKRTQSRRKFKLRLSPVGITLPSEEGQTIMEVLAAAGILIRADCGGQGKCGKCQVSVDPPSNLTAPKDAEIVFLEKGKERPEQATRLACQARIQGDIGITLPAWSQTGDPILPKSEASGYFSAAPAVKRFFVDGARWTQSLSVSSASDTVEDFMNWIHRQAKAASGRSVPIEEVKALLQLSTPEAQTGESTLVTHETRGVTAVLSGVRPKSTGLAVDIGTTSIAAYLCDFQTGEIMAAAGMLNPQQRFGGDVMSRIAFASQDSTGLAQLNALVVQGVNTVLDECLEKAKIDRQDVDEITVVGNPTMQQIFAGFHPHNLGQAPFKPFRRSAINLRASDMGCNLNPGTNLYLFPVVSGFIGGDILGCVLSDRTYTRDEITLVMDIGTNGELVLGNRHGLWATSCATGPALEGAHISCGMRASMGAIHTVNIDPVDFTVSCQAFGDTEGHPVQGLCGSGLIDSIAAMLRTGLILPSGALRSDMPDRIIADPGGARRMVLVPAGKSTGNREIAITAKDIRQVQLAKAALAAGIKLLKRRSGIAHIDRVVLTGAFGTTFNPESAATVGLLPGEIAGGCLEVVPNAAGMGAVRALVNKTWRQEIESLYPKIEALELAADSDFSDTFVEMIPFLLPAERAAEGENHGS